MLEQTSDNFLVAAVPGVATACHAQDGDSEAGEANIAHAVPLFDGHPRWSPAAAGTTLRRADRIKSGSPSGWQTWRPRASMTAFALMVSELMAGCSGAPSRNILGSYFPSWMVCALVGLTAALVARIALKATGLLGEVPVPLVVLLSIGCATTFALWLVWLA